MYSRCSYPHQTVVDSAMPLHLLATMLLAAAGPLRGPPCGTLQLQNAATTAVFSSCTGELAILKRRDGPNMLAGATSAADRGPFAIWVNSPPPWLAVHALDQGSDALDHGSRKCRAGRCVALPNNGSAPLTASGCRLVSHTLTFCSNAIPTLTMALVPKNASIPLHITLVATFVGAGPDPRLEMTLKVGNTGTVQDLQIQTEFEEVKILLKYHLLMRVYCAVP